MTDSYKIRVMTPANDPINVSFHDVNAQDCPYGQAVLLNVHDLFTFADENAMIGIDVGMLNRMLERADNYHTYQKIPVPDKRKKADAKQV